MKKDSEFYTSLLKEVEGSNITSHRCYDYLVNAIRYEENNYEQCPIKLSLKLVTKLIKYMESHD